MMTGKGILAMVAVVVGLSFIPRGEAWAQAQPAAKPAPAVTEIQIHSGDHVKSVLERLAGREVTLALAGGGEMTGILTKVEAQMVHLSRLRGKEFFDAVVRLDAINAIIVRTRTS
jgi:hypothetical protein